MLRLLLSKLGSSGGVLVLVPAIAAFGASGFKRAKGRRGEAVAAKARRMPPIVVNAIVILIPSALYLAWNAQAAEYHPAFYLVQALELAAGAVNLTLPGLSMRDGLRMTGRLTPRLVGP